MDQELRIQISANLDQFSKAMDGALKKVESVGKQMESAGKKMSAAITAPLALIGGVALKNFDRQIKAERRLASAINATGGEAGTQLKQFQAFASELQELTNVGDEATLEMLTLATQMGLNAEQAQRAAKNALGLADAMGIGEQQALRMAAAVEQGDTQMLTRYIPTLRMAENDSEKLAIAQEFMANAFDTAVDAAQEGLGPLEALSGHVGDLTEQFGAIISEAINPFAKRLSLIVKGFQNMDDSTKRLIVTVAALAAAIGPLVATLGFMASTVLPAVVTGFAALFSPVTLIVGAIAALGIGFVALNKYIDANSPITRANAESVKALKGAYDQLKSAQESLESIQERGQQLSKEQIALKKQETIAVIRNAEAILRENDIRRKAMIESMKAEMQAMQQSKLGGGAQVARIKLLSENIKQLEKASSDTELQIFRLSQTLFDLENPSKSIEENIKGVKDEVKTFQAAIVATDPKGLNAVATGFSDIADKVNTKLKPVIFDAKNMISDFELLSQQVGTTVAETFAVGLTDAFTQMLIGGENAFQQFGKMIQQLIARLLVAAAVAALLSALLPSVFGVKGTSSMQGFGALFSGLAGIPQLANGGIASGPTLAMVGEYGGARSNPEVIAPLDKLQSIIGQTGAGGRVEVFGRISGSDILLSNEREGQRRTRRRGF